MEQRNNNQNSIIFDIEELLNKMSNQIRFLIRNEEPMSQLDLDLMMKNTRKLYDTLCSIDVKEDESLQVNETTSQQVEDDERLQDYKTTSQQVEDDDLLTHSLIDSVTPNESLQDNETTSQQVEEEVDLVTQRLGDSVTEEDSGIRAYRKTSNEHHTLGDVLEQAEDNSLAARLQRTAVSDLMTAIGINDKFLLLNELFSGSMEKYNKSIRALNSFSTLLGARTYMSELQIEFQWDCESEAYKKLSDLIERRFI